MRSLNLSPQGLSKAREALTNQGWTYEVLAEKVEPPGKSKSISPQTVKSFFARNKVDRSYFVGICKSLELDWQDVAELPQEKLLHQVIKFSVYDNDWVGRQTLINDLSDRLRESCRILLLVGITGIGKTALAECLVEELRGDWTEDRKNFENGNKPSATLDFASVAAEWLRNWGETLNEEERKPEQLLQRLVKRLCEKQYLILMDSLEYLLTGSEEDGWGDFMDEWWDRFFVSLLSAPFCKSRLILTSQDWPARLEMECSRYQNLWHNELLRGLDTSEQIELFQKVGLDDNLELPHSPLRLIGEVYDGHPLALRVIAGEIKGRDVHAYWNEYRHEIESVKEALDKARQQGIVQGQEDRWKLDSYMRTLRRRVKERLEKTFNRLSNDVYDAYLLLCIASVYRCEVKKSWWLEQLEDEGYSTEQQEAAMQTLWDRYLVEDRGLNHEDEQLVGQHPLIRSVAIAHRLNLPES